MKRPRDEVYMNPPQFRRPSSRGESYGLSQAPNANGGGGAIGGTVGNGGGPGVGASSMQKLTTNDALSYLKQVKDMFQDQSEKYDMFLDVMKDFKGQRIDTSGVIAKVKELFHGHPNLILGFNTFLPKGYEITLTEEEPPPKKAVEFEEAISFVNKIKIRFQNNDHVYKSFLDILNMYRKEHKGIAEVYREVAVLFDGQPDLLDEFSRFLPDTSATVSAPHASFGRNSLHHYDDKSSVLPIKRPSHTDKQLQRKDMNIDPNEERLSGERPDMDDDRTVKRLLKEQKHPERENRDRRNRAQDDRVPEAGNNGNVSMHRFSDKKKSARKVEDHGGTNLTSFDDKDALKSKYSFEFSFCEKVKERLHSADDYQAFLKCLHLYSSEVITRKDLESLVGDLIGKYPDLMEGFNGFLERCERIEPIRDEGNSSKVLRIDEKENEPKHELEGGKEKDKYNLKYWGKSIQELDLSDCQRCTASYRLLPEDYPIPLVSQKSELGNQVLNDHLVSVTSGSEDYSFNHMRKNQYEESLFRCEDDSFELDMLLESVISTAKRAEELLNSINDNSVGSDDPLRIEEHLSVIHLRCIERLYGDHGLDVLDILRKNPSMALSVILTRLKQKQEEWTKCRTDFSKVWADIYSKNHYKSLDHRSFYFKQQDSKNLSKKSLVAEIKEIKEKGQKEDDALLSIAAGNRQSIIPNIEFEYVDSEIHEDIFRIIKFSCEEVSSAEDQINKVLRFWVTFLEPMLGVHSHSYGSETNEDDGASESREVQNDTHLIESEGSPNTTSFKQPESNGNDDSSPSPERVNSSRISFTNVDSLAKELDVGPCKRLSNPDAAVKSGPGIYHGHGASSRSVSTSPVEKGNEAKLMEDLIPSEVWNKSKLNELTNGDITEGSRLSGYNDSSVDPCKNEKEEGELSPSPDFEDNLGAYQDSSLQTLPEKSHVNEGIQYPMEKRGEDASEIDADDDSENISVTGDNVSCSELTAKECSREVENVEHDDLDGYKDQSEGEADTTGEVQYHGGDDALVSQSERLLLTCKPLSKHMDSLLVGDEKKVQGVFYGNDDFYVLFRLHQTLYDRMLSVKVNSVHGESKWSTTKNEGPDQYPYARFMNSLFSLLDGSLNITKFEDVCRSLVGNNQSYVLFTLDRLIYKLVKQLQKVSSSELDCNLLQLYEYEKSRKPEKFVDSVYYENVNVLLHDENIYRFEHTSDPTRLSIQLMDHKNEKTEVGAVSVDPKFATYLHKDYLSVNHGKKESSPVMLKRNMHKYSNLDESTALDKATENTLSVNGLECKMSASSSKIAYVIDTEDSFIRLGRRRGSTSTRTGRVSNVSTSFWKPLF